MMRELMYGGPLLFAWSIQEICIFKGWAKLSYSDNAFILINMNTSDRMLNSTHQDVNLH